MYANTRTTEGNLGMCVLKAKNKNWKLLVLLWATSHFFIILSLDATLEPRCWEAGVGRHKYSKHWGPQCRSSSCPLERVLQNSPGASRWLLGQTYFRYFCLERFSFLIKTTNNKLSHFAKCNTNREKCWPVWGLGEAGWNCVCILKASSHWLHFPAPWPANLSYVRAIPSNWDHVYNWTMASAVISPG